MKRLLTAMTLTLLFSSAVSMAQDTTSSPAATPNMADSSADAMKLEGTKDAAPEVKASKKIPDEAISATPAEGEKKPVKTKKKRKKKASKHHEEKHASESQAPASVVQEPSGK